jgi:hypothetical protein
VLGARRGPEGAGGRRRRRLSTAEQPPPPAAVASAVSPTPHPLQLHVVARQLFTAQVALQQLCLLLQLVRSRRRAPRRALIAAAGGRRRGAALGAGPRLRPRLQRRRRNLDQESVPRGRAGRQPAGGSGQCGSPRLRRAAPAPVPLAHRARGLGRHGGRPTELNAQSLQGATGPAAPSERRHQDSADLFAGLLAAVPQNTWRNCSIVKLNGGGRRPRGAGAHQGAQMDRHVSAWLLPWAAQDAEGVLEGAGQQPSLLAAPATSPI